MMLKVEEMTCGHCVQTITSAIHAIDPRATVQADLTEGTVRITGGLDPALAASALQSEGYPARVLEP